MSDHGFESVDVSVAFLAAVLMIFAFVSTVLIRESPDEELPSVGQPRNDLRAVPPAWSPIPERTSYALLTDDRVFLLELDHFAHAIVDPTRRILGDDHFESARVLKSEVAPNSFILNFSTTAAGMPSRWIRAEVDLGPYAPGDEENVAAAWPVETSCGLSEEDRARFLRPILTVFVIPRLPVRPAAFVRFARLCQLRYRLVSIRDGDKRRFSIPVGLSSRTFALQQIFR